jgi:hypothetical protein
MSGASCLILSGIVRDVFADDFQQSLRHESSPPVRRKLIEACALQQIFNLGDRLQNVPQPVFDGWRHSEHLDQIVGDPLSHARFQHVPHGNLDGNSCRIFDQMKDLEKVERRRVTARRGIDQDIKIAVRSSVTTRTRAENGKPRDASRFDRRLDFTQFCDDRVQRNIDNMIHDRTLAQFIVHFNSRSI